MRVSQECEVKLWRPSGLGSSVILSSAFSLLTLPYTWQDFLLHSWLYNPHKPLSPPPISSSATQTLICMNTLKRVCVRARPPRTLAWCDSEFVWKYEVCVAHFQRIYVVASVTACQIYKAASDPLTRHRCVAVARSKLTHTSQDYYARRFSCAPHILGSLYDFALCNKQVTTSLCLIRHWAQQERHKLIEEVETKTPESAWCCCSSGWAKMGSESRMY